MYRKKVYHTCVHAYIYMYMLDDAGCIWETPKIRQNQGP